MFLVQCIVFIMFVPGQTAQNTNSTDVMEVPPRNIDSFWDELSDLKLQMREEDLNLREEMYSMLGAMSKEDGDGVQSYLIETVKDLLHEVKHYQQLTRELGSCQESTLEKLNEVQSNQESAVEKLVAVQLNQESTLDKLAEVQSTQESTLEKLNEVQTSQESAVEKLNEFQASQQSTVEKINEVQTKQVSTLAQATRCSQMIDLMRSEVRLISLYKLTWQNYTNGPYQSDYVVDGVYNRVNDINGHNPISHSGNTARNQVLIIDLGGRFKIHTVKIWSRISSSEIIGGFVYADDTLLGGIAEVKQLYNFRVRDTVFARKIFLKQSAANYLTALEVQVIGTGPYGDDEV